LNGSSKHDIAIASNTDTKSDAASNTDTKNDIASNTDTKNDIAPATNQTTTSTTPPATNQTTTSTTPPATNQTTSPATNPTTPPATNPANQPSHGGLGPPGGPIGFTQIKIAVIDLITIAAIIEARSELLRKMKPDKLDELLKQGTPKWFCENADLKKIWGICQDELIVNLMVFNSVIMALNRGDAPHEWAEENMVNIATFSSIAQTRNQIIDNMTNIGLDINYNQKYSILNNEADITPREFVYSVKRAIQSGYVFNTMKLVGDNTRPRYIQEYCNSRSEGISNFKLWPEEPIGNIMKASEYPNRVIPIKIGMQQMFSKDGFDEMQPIIKMISVLDDWLLL
jgi:hypothetical protein